MTLLQAQTVSAGTVTELDASTVYKDTSPKVAIVRPAATDFKASALSKHYVGTLICESADKLVDGDQCLQIVRNTVLSNHAQTTGELLHEFPNGSYTLLIGLSESHISIHTWPERLTVQLDVFLCNYIHDNSEKCRRIYEQIVDYFDATESNTTVIRRV